MDSFALSSHMHLSLSRMADAGCGHVGIPAGRPLSQRSHRVTMQHHPVPVWMRINLRHSCKSQALLSTGVHVRACLQPVGLSCRKQR